MKRYLATSLSVIATFVLSGCVHSEPKPTYGLEDIKSMKMFNNPTIEILAYAEHESTHHVTGRVITQQGKSPFSAFITKDLKEVIFGKGYDASTQKTLETPFDMKPYVDKAIYTYGEGKDEYVLFTDPECPFCQKLERLIPLMKKDAKFHVLLYPLDFHKKAIPMSHYILSKESAEEKHKAFNDIANGSTEYTKATFSKSELEKYTNIMSEQAKLGLEFGVGGRPSVYTTKGQKIEWPDLLTKYAIQMPVDMKGVEFLQKNKLEIQVSNNNKEPLFIFASLENEQTITDLEKALDKYKDTNSVNLFIKLDAKLSTLDTVKAVYSQPTNKMRLSILDELFKNKKPTKAMIDIAKGVSREDETKYIPVGYVMSKMQLDTSKTLTVLNKNGVVVK